MGVARRLVEVAVHADHELQRIERDVQPLALRCAEGGIARDGDERAYLPRARRRDLLGKDRDGQLARDLWRAAHTAFLLAGAHAATLARDACRVARASR